MMRTRKKDSCNEISPQRIQQLEQTVESLGKKIGQIDEIENNISKVADRLLLSKEILTSSEACTFLGISESYLYKLTSLKLIPHYKPNGRLVYFNLEELKQWAMRNPCMAKRIGLEQPKPVAL